MKSSRHILFLTAVLGIIAILIFILQNKTTNKKNETVDKNIVTTSYPVYFIADKVARDGFKTENLMANSPDAHDFEPTLQMLEKLRNASVGIVMGTHLDEWANKVLLESNSSIKLASNVKMMRHRGSNEPDPHYWMDFENIKLISKVISLKLSSVDAQNSSKYSQNSDVLNSDMDKIAKEYDALSECKNKNIVVSHNAYNYLLQKYGINIMQIAEDEHLHAEPSISSLKHIMDEAKKYNIKTVFYESDETKKSAELLAKELGGEAKLLYTLEARPPSGIDFTEMLKENLKNLKEAMLCK